MKKIIEGIKDFFKVLFKETTEEDDILFKTVASQVMVDMLLKKLEGGDAV